MADDRVLLILVPGAGIQAGDFHDQGFIAAVAARGRPVSVRTVDPGMDSYLDGSATRRLLLGIEQAQRDTGIARLWLAGVSLGCQGILRCLRARPGGASGWVEGLLLLTPYLASTGLVAQVAASGGLRRWTPDDTPDADLLGWLATAALPRTLLGYAAADRFAAAALLLAGLLPADRVIRVDGGHDWTSWRALWTLLLARDPFAPLA